MAEESPRLRKASHVGLWVGMIAVIGWLTWSATHSKNTTKNQRFESGSKQTNVYNVTKKYALASLELALTPFSIHGCVRADKMESSPEKTTTEPLDVTQLNAIDSDAKS